MAGKDDAVHTGTFRSSDECADIVRVFDLIKDQKEWSFSFVLCHLKDLVELGILFRGSNCKYALCMFVGAEFHEPLSVDFFDGDAAPFCDLTYLLETSPSRPEKHVHFFQGSVRSQSFEDRLSPFDQVFHEVIMSSDVADNQEDVGEVFRVDRFHADEHPLATGLLHQIKQLFVTQEIRADLRDPGQLSVRGDDVTEQRLGAVFVNREVVVDEEDDNLAAIFFGTLLH